MKKYITIIIALILFIAPVHTNALSTKNESSEKIYLFYGKECPH